MAFDQAMKSMGGKMKPKSAKNPDEQKGKEKPEPKGKVDGEQHDGGGEHEPIHAHLMKMHEMTGNAHSHIEHHFDGHHTSHHISEHGEMSGPHEHANTEELKGHMDQMMGGGGGDEQQQPMQENMQQHPMSGF